MSGGVMSRQELIKQGRAYVALQRQHLDREETEAFASIDSSLTDEDWKAIEADMPAKDDPLFSLPDITRFQILFQYLSECETAEEG